MAAPYLFSGLENFQGAPLLSRGTDPASWYVTGKPRHNSYRTPVSAVLPNGNIVLFFTPRPDGADQSNDTIIRLISSDGGRTWGDPVLVHERSDYIFLEKWLNLGSVCVTASGRTVIVFVYAQENPVGGLNPDDHTVYTMYSDDPDPAAGSWSTPVDITTDVDDSGADDWLIPGPGDMIEIRGGSQAGFLVYPMYARVEGNTPGHLVLVVSQDGGATWARGGECDILVDINSGCHETTICELRDATGAYTGVIYCNSRSNNSSYNTKRLHVKITDVLSPLPDMTVMSDGSADVPSQGCHGSCISDSAGNLLVQINSNSSRRGHMRVWVSTNATAGTPTFPSSRVIADNCAYSTLRETSPGNYLSVHERSINRQMQNAGTSVPDEFIFCARFNRAYLEATLAEDPEIMDFPFNEATSGPVSQRGAQVRDHGRHGFHMEGHGATGASWGDGYVAFDGAGVGLLAQVDSQGDSTDVFGGPWDWRNDSFTLTWKMQADSTLAAGDNVVLDGRNNSSTVVGWTLKVADTTRRLRLEWNDTTTGGNNQSNEFSAASVADDTMYRWYLVRNRVAGTVQMFRVTSDGTVTAGASTVDTRGAIVGSIQIRLGSRQNGTEPLKGHIGPLRFIRGQAFTASDMTFDDMGRDTRTLFELNGGDKIVQPTLPASYANCVLAAGVTWDGGYGVSVGKYGGWDHGRLPPHPGQGVGAIRELIHDRLFEQILVDRAGLWHDTDKCGLMIRPHHTSNAASGNFRRTDEAGTTTAGVGLAETDNADDYDFFANTGNGAMCVVAEFIASTGISQNILSCRKSTSPDMQIQRVDDGTLLFQVRRASGANVISQTFEVNIALNTPYYLGFDMDAANVTGNGANKVILYYGAFTEGLASPATLTEVVSSGSISISGTTHHFAEPMHIGSNAALTAHANWRFKNLLLFNAPLDTAGHQAWAELAVQDGLLAVETSVRRNRNHTGRLRRMAAHLLGRGI